MPHTLEQFKVGQKVKLKSGGPEMTVIPPSELVEVEWVGDLGRRCREIFHAASLKSA